MKWYTVAAIGLTASVEAGLRFQCSTISIQRLDPVVQPGANPSLHLHHIVGGNSFNATMTGDRSALATCTTCEMSQDFSNYWTAVVYFKHPTNGSYHRVNTKPVNPGNLDGYSGTSGGLTVYYTQYDLLEDNIAQQPITAFKPGFRMTVGNPNNNGTAQVGLRYQCLDANTNRGPEIADFPPSPCAGGIFVTHHFPACWDGVNLDSPDHQSHMYNTITQDGFVNAGPCPSSHPVRMPQVTFETVWDTTPFNSMWESGQPNPFVWSFEGINGVNGPGTHADYMFGWQGTALQDAMDKNNCFYDGCGSITKQQMSIANQCTVKDFVGENIDGWVAKMPGNP
ncbi:hypothetical protein F5Y16DRAFT_412599 [Xylariaceae sp. FL0255]|nr:hypothetical protein F5Y16DRAFT_412599 [Xylariaceae sp. FL0255]